jgi:hypothetical protein
MVFMPGLSQKYRISANPHSLGENSCHRSLSPISDDFDLDFGVDHQLCLRRRSRRFVPGEEFGVDPVEGPEVARVVQPYGGLDDVLRRAAGESKRLFDILQGLAGLRLDAAGTSSPLSPIATCPDTNTNGPALTADEKGSGWPPGPPRVPPGIRYSFRPPMVGLRRG